MRTDAPQPAKPKPAKRPQDRRRPLPPEIVGELVDALGDRRAPRARRDLTAAAEAYAAGRYADALKYLRPLVRVSAVSPSVRELHGLTLYRLGRWRAALDELRAYHDATGDPTQLPAMADCERALGHHRAVEEVWRELRQASPAADTLAEGRLVAAGSLADRGRLQDAIELLAPYGGVKQHPKEWHLRTWYALADLYERAGEVPRARELFRRIVARDAGFFDVAERLAALR